MLSYTDEHSWAVRHSLHTLCIKQSQKEWHYPDKVLPLPVLLDMNYKIKQKIGHVPCLFNTKQEKNEEGLGAYTQPEVWVYLSPAICHSG